MMNRSGTIGIILIVIGVLALTFVGSGFGPGSWGPGMMGPGMPRWQMSEQDLNDLIAYLKTLR